MRTRRGWIWAAALLGSATLLYALHAHQERKVEVEALVARTKHNLVFMEGGTYMMGDFGTIQGPKYHDGVVREGELPYTPDEDNKPAHKVTVDGFSIGKYKVTYEDFDVYTNANGLPRIGMDDDMTRKNRHPKATAGVNWFQAKAYCTWLAKVSGLPIDLPTEAQWEFAARSRGQMIPFPTDTGWDDPGKNFATAEDAHKFWRDVQGNGEYNMAVGLYPPTPMGLYDMGQNGYEWMEDWYDPEYYQHSPEKNPRGPATGTRKVLRARTPWESSLAFTMERRKQKPIPAYETRAGEDGKRLDKPREVEIKDPVSMGFRLVVNLGRPVNSSKVQTPKP